MSLFQPFGPPNVAKLKEKNDMKGLIGALSYQKDSRIRIGAARALGEMGEPYAVDPLIDHLNDADALVRQFSIEALEKIGEPRAIGPITEVTLYDKDESVRHIGIMTLGRIGNNNSVNSLFAALEDKNPIVCICAADVFISAYSDEKNIMHDLVVEKKGTINNNTVKPVVFSLINSLKRGQFGMAPTWAEELLTEFNGKAVEPLILILKNNDREKRRWAAEALGLVGDSRAVEPLIVALEDSDYHVRDYVIRALGKIGDDRAIEGLVAALNGKYVEQDIYEIAKALAEIGNLTAVEPLITKLNDLMVEPNKTTSTHSNQKDIINALGKLGDSRAVEPLITIMDSDDGIWVLEETIRALGEIGDEKVMERLLRISSVYPEEKWDDYKWEGSDFEFSGYEKSQGRGRAARAAIAKIQERQALSKGQ